ncbi:MAG: hypothetical protein ACLP8S_12965 [Solirubrobacteraceae bacterium]
MIRHHRHITCALASTLALAATTAPGATAHLRPAAPRKTPTASPVVRPNPDEQVLTSYATPATSEQTTSPLVQPNPDEQTPPTIAHSTTLVDSVPTVRIVRVSYGGFDWGDAGLGAATGLGLSLITFSGVLAVSRRRDRAATSASATH